MTEADASPADAMDDHDALEPADGGHAVTTTPFDATVTAAEPVAADAVARFEVTVTVPSLDAAVAGESVPPVVEDGWFEPLQLRLGDAFDVAEVDAATAHDVDRRADAVVATYAFDAGDAERGVAAAKAIVDYVEGTYLQGIVPGYEYREPVASLRSRAARQARDAGAGGTRSDSSG